MQYNDEFWEKVLPKKKKQEEQEDSLVFPEETGVPAQDLIIDGEGNLKWTP